MGVLTALELVRLPRQKEAESPDDCLTPPPLEFGAACRATGSAAGNVRQERQSPGRSLTQISCIKPQALRATTVATVVATIARCMTTADDFRILSQ